MSKSSPSPIVQSPILDIILFLQREGFIKYGEFTLKSGQKSNIYLDFRQLIGYPEIMKYIVQLIKLQIEEWREFDLIAGVPYNGIPTATVFSQETNIPMIYTRKEAKDYGTKKMVEGKFQPGQRVLLLDDVMTTGGSLLSTIEMLEDNYGLQVVGIFVLADRRTEAERTAHQSKFSGEFYLERVINEHLKTPKNEETPQSDETSKSEETLKSDGIPQSDETPKSESASEHNKVNGDRLIKRYPIKSLLTLEQIEVVVSQFVDVDPTANLLTPNVDPTTTRPYRERYLRLLNPFARRTWELMHQKRTNLVLSADLTSMSELCQLVEQVGKFICVLKVHFDLMNPGEINSTSLNELANLLKQHQILLLEDRKLSDIGQTVAHQLKGPFSLNEYVQAVTAHAIFGAGTLEGIHQAAPEMGVLLVAQASAEGNLINKAYTQATVDLANRYPETVAGFITQQSMGDPNFLNFTPGVHMQQSGDSLRQRYRTPEQAIVEQGNDLIIVGRGITAAENPQEAAEVYKNAAWASFSLASFTTTSK